MKWKQSDTGTLIIELIFYITNIFSSCRAYFITYSTYVNACKGSDNKALYCMQSMMLFPHICKNNRETIFLYFMLDKSIFHGWDFINIPICSHGI